MADSPNPLSGFKDRQELSSMGFMEHLEELRRRIIHSAVSIVVGFCVCYGWHEKIYGWMQAPISNALTAHHLPTKIVYTNPIDPFNMYLKVSLIMGIFVASPYILYQVWGFIKPGLYRHERRYVGPFMASTVGLFIAGGLFAYKMVYPAAIDFLIGYSAQFAPMITINEYTSQFITIMLGVGLVFEMPILIFFLALFGLVSAGFMWRNFRYAILLIFVVACAVAPTPDVITLCLFAAPMIGLYIISIGLAWLVHPKQRKARAEAKEQK
jgi:sec-independent protein translocase protein TatC